MASSDKGEAIIQRSDENPTVLVGNLAIDLRAREVRQAGRSVDLTAREFQILAHLAEHPGWVYSPQQILREVWGYDYVDDPRPVYTHINNLRVKLRSGVPARSPIVTVRGFGYRLEKPSAPSPASGAPDLLEFATPSVGDVPLVNRKQEMVLLLEGLERAAEGQGSILLLWGDAGMGKTRLAGEVAGRAAQAGTRVLRAHCQEACASSPFWPWTQLLRPLTELLSQGDIRGSLDHALGQLSALLPELAERYPGGLPDPLEPGLLDARTRFFDAVIAVIGEAARVARFVLILEDLEHCDEESLLLLQAVASRLPDWPVLVLATFDQIGRGSSDPLRRAVCNLEAAGCRTVSLAGLGADAIQELAARGTGVEPPQSIVLELAERTGGNPLFVIELARLMAEDGSLRERATAPGDSDGGHPSTPCQATMPRAIRSVIEGRLGRISAPCRDLLALAALLGQSFSLQLVAAASGLSCAELLEPLDEALAARLLEREEAPGIFRFSHSLLSDVLAADLGEAARLDLHARVCAAYERLFDVEDVLDQLAYHSYQASPLFEAAKAVDYSERAGQRALRRYGFEAAVEHFRRALVLLPLQRGNTGQRQAKATVLKEALGDALRLSLRIDEAVAAYREGLSLALSPDRVRRARLWRKSAEGWLAKQQLQAAKECLDAAERALACSDPETDDEAAQEWIEVQLRRTRYQYYQGELPKLEETINGLLARVEARGSPSQKVSLREQQFAMRCRIEHYRPSGGTVDLARDLLEEARVAGDTSQLCQALFRFGFALLWAGQLDESERQLRACREEAQRTQDRRHAIMAASYLAIRHRRAGKLAETEEWALLAESEADVADLAGYLAVATANRAWASWRQGDAASAESLAEDALHLWNSPSAYPFEWLARWPLTALHLLREDTACAIDQVRSMLTEIQQPMPWEVQAVMAEAVSQWDMGNRTETAHAIGRALALLPLGYV